MADGVPYQPRAAACRRRFADPPKATYVTCGTADEMGRVAHLESGARTPNASRNRVLRSRGAFPDALQCFAVERGLRGRDPSFGRTEGRQLRRSRALLRTHRRPDA